MRSRLSVWFVVVVGCLFGAVVASRAAEDQRPSPSERIRALEQKVLRLERRLAEHETLIVRLYEKLPKLSAKPAGRSATRPGPEPPPEHSPWTKLRAGMSSREVTRLLGDPTTLTRSGRFATWHYETPAGLGTIWFDNFTVLRWREP